MNLPHWARQKGSSYIYRASSPKQFIHVVCNNMKAWVLVVLWLGMVAGLFYPVVDFRSLNASPEITFKVSRKLVVKQNGIANRAPQVQLKQVEVPWTQLVQPLYTDDSKAIYYANITVIDPEANYHDQFLVLVDTGSPLTWLYNQLALVGSVPRFNSPRSLESTTTKWYDYAKETVKFAMIDGDEGVHFRINDLQFTNLTWGLTSDSPKMLAPYDILGLLGILPRAGPQNVLSEMANKLLIPSAQFSLYLLSQPRPELAGLILWGEDDSRPLFTNNTVIWEPVVSDLDYWLVNMTRSQQVIIDTGTTGVVLPLANATELHNRQFGTKNVIADGDGNFAFPCNALGSIQVAFANLTLEIIVDNVKGNEYAEYPGYCALKIQGIGSQWIFGAAFLKGYYTTFDIDRQRIGFAKLPTNTTFKLSGTSPEPVSSSLALAVTATSLLAVASLLMAASPQPLRKLEGGSSRLVPAGFGVVIAAVAVALA